MAVNLTPGAIMQMCFAEQKNFQFQPVLQVIDLRLVQSTQSCTERYRAVLSDGSYYEQGMLATQKNDLVHTKRLQKGSIVKLLQFITNKVQGRKIIILFEVDVIMSMCELIGKLVHAPREAPPEFVAIQAGNAASAAIGNAYSTSSESQSLTLIEDVSNWHPFQ